MSTLRLVPKNWASFQHYKDRAPAWIKLHKSLLDDFDFQCLPVASRALAPMLWLLASEQSDGVIDASAQKLAFRLRMDADDFIEALKPLIDGGFFLIDSGVLAACYRDDSLEEEVEREKEVEKRVEPNGSMSPQDGDAASNETQIVQRETVHACFRSFCQVAAEVGLPVPERETAKRRKSISARLREYGEDSWARALSKIRGSPFLRGETGRDTWNGADIDWLIKPNNYPKVLEGKYDAPRKTTPGGPAGEPSRYDRFLRGNSVRDADDGRAGGEPDTGFGVIEGGRSLGFG